MNNEEIKFIFCTECGTKNEADANFCTSCGAKLIKPVAAPTPVVISEPEEAVSEEAPEVIPEAEEATPEEAAEPVVEAPAEETAVEESAPEEPEEEPLPEVVPIALPVEEEAAAEEPAVEEAVAEEPTPEEIPVEEPEEEPIPEAAPVTAPKVKEEEPEKEPEEQPKEEPVVPVVIPVAPKVSKKEAKLEKKLEEAKKQAQEQARKEAQKAEAKAQKAAEKAQKAEEKAQKAAEKAEKKTKKSEKQTTAATVQNNSHYYYNHESESAAPAPVTEKPKKKRRQNFFLKILSFLLSLVLLASLAVAVPITLLNLFLTDHNIDVIVDRAISSIELEKIEFSTAGGTKTLSGALHDITNEFDGWDHITEEQINDALLEDFVKQFVTDALAQLGMSLKEGEAMLGWTPEQIYDFIEANKETIESLAREAGYEGKLPIEEKKDMIITNIEERIGEDGISASALLGSSDETEDLARYLELAQALFSVNTLYLAWALVAFIVILIAFTNLGYFGAFCRACGFPAFLVGAIYFLAGLGVSPILSIADLPIPIFASAVEFTAGFLAAMLMDISLIVTGVGFVLIIISFISDAIRRKIDSKKNA